MCFPETLNVPRGEAEANNEVEGRQNSLFPLSQSLSVLIYRRTQEKKKNAKKTSACLNQTAQLKHYDNGLFLLQVKKN